MDKARDRKPLEKQGFHACPASCSAQTHLLQLIPDITEQLLVVAVVSVHQGGDSLSGQKAVDGKSSGILLPVPSWDSPCPCPYRQRDEWLPLQELADHLLLDPLQIKVLQGLPSLLHAVLAVGQDQRDQVLLHLVTDQVQLGHFRGADQVPAGSKGALWSRESCWRGSSRAPGVEGQHTCHPP